MKCRFLFLALVPCLLAGCASVPSLNTYEQDDLVTIQHNDNNSYTLLIYRDPLGQTRQVLRRHGVCELVLTYSMSGDIRLKERGHEERLIDPVEAGRITQFVNALMRVGPTMSEQTSQI